MIETLLLIDEEGDPLYELPPVPELQQPEAISKPFLLRGRDCNRVGTVRFEIDSLSQDGRILRYRRTEVILG
jgi:hypothetical protein